MSGVFPHAILQNPRPQFLWPGIYIGQEILILSLLRILIDTAGLCLPFIVFYASRGVIIGQLYVTKSSHSSYPAEYRLIFFRSMDMLRNDGIQKQGRPSPSSYADYLCGHTGILMPADSFPRSLYGVAGISAYTGYCGGRLKAAIPLVTAHRDFPGINSSGKIPSIASGDTTSVTMS